MFRFSPQKIISLVNFSFPTKMSNICGKLVNCLLFKHSGPAGSDVKDQHFQRFILAELFVFVYVSVTFSIRFHYISIYFHYIFITFLILFFITFSLYFHNIFVTFSLHFHNIFVTFLLPFCYHICYIFNTFFLSFSLHFRYNSL